MMKHILAAIMLFCLTAPAFGARILPTPDFSLDVPNDWQHARAAKKESPAAVSAILECLDEDPAHLIMGGWKMEGEAVQAAFCVSYWSVGAAKTLNLLKGPGKDEAFGKFADIFASKIYAGYEKRRVEISDLSATLLKAAEMAVTTIDGRVKTGGKVYMRSDTVFLRQNAILNVSTIYDVGAPDFVGSQADALPMSVEWK